MANEAKRYERAGNLNVEAVEFTRRVKPEPLLSYEFRRNLKRSDPGFRYARRTLPKQQFATIEDALAAIKGEK